MTAETATEATDSIEIVCRGCETPKPASEFQRDAKGKHGRRARCKFCTSKKPAAAEPQPEPEPEPVAQPEPQPSEPKAAKDRKPVRTTVYLEVITRPMTVQQVEAALSIAGWPDEGRPKVVATLGYLVARRGKLTVAETDGVQVYAPVA